MPTIFRDPIRVVDLDSGVEIDMQTPNIITDILTGWNSTSGVEPSFTNRGGGDGARSSGAWLSREKYLTLGGAVAEYSRDAAETTRELLWGVFQPEAHLAIDRTMGSSVRRMFVRVYDVVDEDQPVEEGFRFTIPLVALDPYKYSADSSIVEAGAFSGDEWYRVYSDDFGDIYSDIYMDTVAANRTYDTDTYRTYVQPDPGLRPTSATVVNDGNAFSNRLKILIFGPLNSGDWTIVNETTEQSQVIDINIPDGTSIVVDSYEEKTTIEGSDITSLTYGDWLRLAPGVNTLRLVTGSENDTAYMVVESYSSWR